MDTAAPPAVIDPGASSADLRAVEDLARAKRQILDQIERRVVGQREVIEELLIALFARGHCLLVGVPGLAKTLLISHAGRRARPDLQPHPVHARPDALRHHRHRRARGGPRDRPAASFRFVQGPIFANIILADEINRTPPKTQAALLEAMQEYQVTAGGDDLPARPAVLRPRDAEPDRAGGHLPAARGAARPLHVHRRRRLPERRGRGPRSCSARPRATRPTLEKVLSPETDPRAAGARPPRAGGRPRGPLRGRPRPPHAARRSPAAPSS